MNSYEMMLPRPVETTGNLGKFGFAAGRPQAKLVNVFKHYGGAAVSPQDNFVAEHCGVSSLVIHPEDPKLKLDERNGLLSGI